MPNYNLNRLGDVEFERLFQALLKKVIGAGTVTFGEGPDGGREATYSGKADYPSRAQQWKGEWIFQAKFHDIQRIGADKARKQIPLDLKDELGKITGRYDRKCDNYILATNVPLSSVPTSGTHGNIADAIAPEFRDKIKNIQVWGFDEIARLPHEFREVKNALSGFCDALNEGIESMPGQWEITGLIIRFSQIKGLEEEVALLLEILSRMSDGRLKDRSTRGFYRFDSAAKVLQKVYKTAVASGDLAFDGFLKCLSSSIQSRRCRENLASNRLHLDTQAVLAKLEDSGGAVLEGAIWALAYSDLVGFEDRTRMLGYSKNEKTPFDYAWAELATNMVGETDSLETTSYLESIFSTVDQYPQSVRCAALEQYRLIAKSTAEDIRKQEQSLGLPQAGVR